MKIKPSKNQSGFALIIFVIALMGAGGLLLIGYSNGMLDVAESKKFEYNKRVLKEAKQALLQFAYNYPVTNSNGPGRLPCADTDNDGIPNTCSSLGRLPWNQQNLNLYDIRDSEGERLWYAVSSNFFTQATTVNSDTSGNITLRDQSGNIIYDGSNPGGLTKYGIAAVIIAPGAIIDRNGVSQVRSLANINNPVHYLDLVTGTEDNASFTLNDATDGLILGPIDNFTNDQFIVITAAEVIEVAEKATLQAYRTAINDYLTQTGNVYPWLYNYAGVPDIAGLSSYFPADSIWATELATNLDNFGRVPSISADYFTEADSQPIETLFSGSVSLDDAATSPVTFNQLTLGGASVPGSGTFNFLDGPTLDFQTLTSINFVDLGTPADGAGRFTATASTPGTFTYDVYFWEKDNSPYLGGATKLWRLCAAGADEFSDCNRDSAGNPTPGALNQYKMDIIHLVVTLDFTGVANFDLDYTNPGNLVISPPVAANSGAHASITGTYAGAAVTSLPFMTATYERDEHYHVNDLDIDMFYDDLGPESNADDATGTLVMDDFGRGPLSLTMRYYPELPDWVVTNGWQNSVMMAYADDYRPDANGAAGDCVVNPPCIQLIGLAGTNDDKVSVLVLAGEDSWIDGDINPAIPADGTLANDLGDVFNLENSDLDNLFDIRTVEDSTAPGDTQLDKILVIN